MAQPLPTKLPVPITDMPAAGGVQPYGTRGGNNTSNAFALVTAAYSVQPGEQIDCDTTGGSFVVTLPDAKLCPGKVCRVQDATGAAALFAIEVATVAGSNQTVNGINRDPNVGAPLAVGGANAGVSVRSNGANWTYAG